MFQRLLAMLHDFIVRIHIVCEMRINACTAVISFDQSYWDLYRLRPRSKVEEMTLWSIFANWHYLHTLALLLHLGFAFAQKGWMYTSAQWVLSDMDAVSLLGIALASALFFQHPFTSALVWYVYIVGASRHNSYASALFQHLGHGCTPRHDWYILALLSPSWHCSYTQEFFVYPEIVHIFHDCLGTSAQQLSFICAPWPHFKTMALV